MGKQATKKQATPKKPKAVKAPAEQPRSRYEGDEIMETDESVYLPPHMNLEAMTKEEIGATSMRYFGHRPPENATKEVQIAQVQRELRAGLPGYGRGR